MKGLRACLLACALLGAGGGGCGSGSSKSEHGSEDAAASEPADAGWYVPDAGPPTTMTVTGTLDVAGKGPRAGGTLRMLQDDFDTNRTCGGTVCVTGRIAP
ncbi:MAG TPA: hypothetical protein VMZ28_29205 [Kofleriaceae bacterium]|nr:hypothetical protein [Kofleriaceae bacterium]